MERRKGQGFVSTPTSIITATPGPSAAPVPACPPQPPFSPPAPSSSSLGRLTYAQVAAKSTTPTRTISLLQARPVSAEFHPQTQECAARCSSCSTEALMPKVAGLEEYVALDCEMYYTNRGISLGRVTVVDHTGYILCDVFVRPKTGERIVNYCTEKSGIRPIHILKYGKNFDDVRAFVARLIEDKVLVIHDRVHDFKVLELDHPRHLTRDTATALHLIRRVRDPRDTRPLMKVGLKTLASALLGRSIQEGEHCSLVDARVTMAVYRQVHQDWMVGPEHELPPPQPRTNHRHGSSRNKKGQHSQNNLRLLQLSAVRSWRGETAVDYCGIQRQGYF